MVSCFLRVDELLQAHNWVRHGDPKGKFCFYQTCREKGEHRCNDGAGGVLGPSSSGHPSRCNEGGAETYDEKKRTWTASDLPAMTVRQVMRAVEPEIDREVELEVEGL